MNIAYGIDLNRALGGVSSMSELQDKINKRRTFAIISHPDAGKTTLTEKLLLYGGAILHQVSIDTEGAVVSLAEEAERF